MEYESLLFISQLNWAWACTDTRNQTQGELPGFTRKISSVCILHHISLSKQPDTQTVIPTSDTGKINFKKLSDQLKSHTVISWRRENSTPALPAQVLDPYRATSQSVSLAPEWQIACADTQAILLGATRMSLEGNVWRKTHQHQRANTKSHSAVHLQRQRESCAAIGQGGKLSLQVNTFRTSHACDYSGCPAAQWSVATQQALSVRITRKMVGKCWVLICLSAVIIS